MVTFKKVKAHSGDDFNDLSDTLANSARALSPIEINSTRLPNTLMTRCGVGLLIETSATFHVISQIVLPLTIS